MDEKYKRQVARKARISDLLNGVYVRKEGTEPSYIEFNPQSRISRANVIATVVAVDGENSFLIDDGTGSINVRSFEPINVDVSIGMVILLIGKIREFNSQRYIVPEIIKPLKNTKWIEVRKKELEQIFYPVNDERPDIQDVEIKDETVNRGDRIYNLIKSMDKGDGVETEEVINSSGEDDAEEIILNLLKEGNIFEVRPGWLKALE